MSAFLSITSALPLKADVAAVGRESPKLTLSTVTRWLRDGYLRGFKLGKEWRIAPSDLRAFMEEHANQPLDTASGS